MKVLDSYSVESEGITAQIQIVDDESFTNMYLLHRTKVRKSTEVVMDFLKQRIIDAVNISASEVANYSAWENLRASVKKKAHELVRTELGNLDPKEEDLLIGKLLQEMLGVSELEFLLADEQLEEVVVISSKDPVWVYHRKYGWLKTNMDISSEEKIRNYASIMGRRVGKQITNLDPLMDAYLLSGHRVNATLSPVSAKGNSITIRKFRKDPFTVIDFINPSLNTTSVEALAFIWLAVQYEMNMLVGGGTASGKTSFLNAILAFTPPNQRVVSIEDTRELVLPSYLHWTPMVTRLPNPEGKGGVSMLDLAVNSLRMRPDRIVLGEVRRKAEAEVLFEAMHTGHSVYSTLHADDSAQMKSRLISPPIDLPEQFLSALHIVVVQYRQRRTGIRRTTEIAEIIPGERTTSFNVIYQWDAQQDKLEKVDEHMRIDNEIKARTGMKPKEITADLEEKKTILLAMSDAKINKVDDVGKIFAKYYKAPKLVVESAQKDAKELRKFL
ncbi:MAG: type II/IV secretion system ATPase subunit [Candidatus Micrarchaeia archaeon]|jgi:flagellar protein FlaI